MKTNKSLYIILFSLMFMMVSIGMIFYGDVFNTIGLVTAPISLVIFIVGFVMGLKGK